MKREIRNALYVARRKRDDGGQVYDQPEDLKPLYKAIAPDPKSVYGGEAITPPLLSAAPIYKYLNPMAAINPMLPIARNTETGDLRFAMPPALRDAIKGGLDLVAATKTGELTPEALSTFTMASPTAGAALAPRGALAAGAAKLPKAVARAPDEVGAGAATELGGLKFPEAESADRMRLRDKRIASGKNPGEPGNERTVIPAPDANALNKIKYKGRNDWKPEEVAALRMPDFVTGKISFDDWKRRHETILTPEEIQKAAAWYKDIDNQFKQYYPNDPELAKKHRNAWLVAQQNISPAGAMNNVLMQQEQMNRGLPPNLWKAGGMPNPTEAARSVLRDQPIEGGVGQKISDFVDSAEGKNVRSWMGNHQKGGSPFVVDVHTARDTGMVDEELISHLKRLGYDGKKLDALKKDLGTSPTAPAYENRADFGRALTNHLNSIKWQGRSDWTPAEVQAVGWMGMTKLTRNAAEDSESGLERNLRRMSFEIAPGESSPWHKRYGPAFDALAEDDKHGLSKVLTEQAMEHARNLAGIHLQDLVHGTGAGQKFLNPSAVGQTLSTQEGADVAAHTLGYLLNQTEVWHHRVKPMTSNPKGYAVDFIEHGSQNLADPKELQGLWEKIMSADKSGLIQGYQPITTADGRRGIRALVDKGGKTVQEKLDTSLKKGGDLDALLSNLPYDVQSRLHEAEITKARNDWGKDKNGQAYLSRLQQVLGRNPRTDLDRARSQLEKELEGYLKSHAGFQGQAPRKALGGSVNYAPSEAQKAAGNYAKEHISFQGIPISIENKKGSERSGIGPDGKRWRCTLPADYGYIKRTEGADGDHVDVYVGPHKESRQVFLINQVDHKSKRFDEHKAMLGYHSEREALADYCAAFSDGHGHDRVGSVEPMSVEGFRHWLKGDTKSPADGRDVVRHALLLARKGVHDRNGKRYVPVQ